MMHSLRRPWLRAALVGGVGGASAYAAWRLIATSSAEAPRSEPAVPIKSASSLSPVKSSAPDASVKTSPSIDKEKSIPRKIREAEVRANAGHGRPVWVTFGHGVYDITEFIESHPGGEIILQAAGGALEPYFALYGQHNVPFVHDLLEEYRIGDLEEGAVSSTSFSDPYVGEPVRSPQLRVRSQKPFNAEPDPRVMGETQVTPNELFYVRNHLPVPDVNPETYRLKIVGLNGETIKSLSFAELKSFPKHSVSATLQCAGNRRDEMSALHPVKGGSWDIAAIGNAVWSGARLTDVVNSAEMAEARHICFEGLDRDPVADTSYGASVPIDVIQDVDDVLLAYEMNGDPLARDHGFPVRAIVPGVVAARDVKWLGEVRLSTEESHSHWQRRDYKGFSPAVNWDNVNFDTAPAIQELPVVSAICDANVNWDKKEVEVSGYAWSGGGRGIIRVDVSADGGKHWTEAELRAKEEQRNRVYDWTLWKAVVPVEGERGLEIVCKAVDSTYNTQPEDVGPIWNLRGVLNNAWHRVRVEGKEKS